MRQSLLRKSHSFRNTIKKSVTQRISNLKESDNNTIFKETEEKNMDSKNLMNSLDIITLSLNSEERGKDHISQMKKF